MPAAKKTQNDDGLKPGEPGEEEKVDALIEAINVPKIREQTITAPEGSIYAPPGSDGWTRTYKQQKLQFLDKLEFTRIVGKALKNALSGDDGIDLGQIMASVSGDTNNADTFIYAIAQLAEYAPDLVKDIVILAMGVPTHERPIVSDILNEPHDEETGAGGLSDEDGLEILSTFVGQNGKAMRDFFLEKLPKLGKEAQAAMAGPESTPGSSKRSRRSARTTQ